MMRRLRDHLLNVLAPLAMVIVLLVPSLSAQMGVDLFTAGEKTQRVRPMDEQPLLFLQAVNFDAGGSDASSLAVADVNGDGKPDIIAANHSSNSVAVLLGNGDGTFEPAVAYPSGGVMPGAVAVADLNSDGNLDIAVVNWWASSGKNVDPTAVIGVLLGNGDGTYQPAVVLRLSGVYGSSLAVADLNGDGKADLVVTRTASRTNWDGVVSVLLGNGDGTFRPEVAYNSGGQGDSLPLAVGDVNGDNKADLLVWNAGTGSLGVLLGNGDGTFRPVATYATAGGGLTLADVNRDGKLDLVVAGGSVLVLLGNGDGTFQPAVAYEPGGASATSLAVADVDGDGKPDLVVANYCDDYNYCFYGVVGVLIGNGDGTFQPPTAYFSGGHFALATAASDVNCDGAPDTIVGNGDSAAVLLNNRGAPSTTTTLVSNRNPVLVKQAVTYTAAVTTQSGETPEGTVLFRDYSTPPWMRLATVPLAGGQAAYSTTYARNSTHSITATYSGDLHHDAGSRSATLTEYVLNTSKTSLTTSGSPSYVGQGVTFTATVTSRYGAIPDGELVTFYDTAKAMASVALSGGKAAYTTSSLSAKKHGIQAIYAGDTNFMPSTGRVVQMVNKYPTTTALTSNPNPSNYGHPVTFTATVTPSGSYALAGKVKFWDGTTSLGSVALSGGVAKLTRSNLAVGTHAITAQYMGDAYNDKSTSPVVNQVVQ